CLRVGEGWPVGDDPRRELDLLCIEGPAQELSPGDGGHAQRLPSIDPVAQAPVFGRTGYEGIDQKARVQVNHSRSALLDDASRSWRLPSCQAAATLPLSPTDLWRALNASSRLWASSGAGAFSTEWIARRSASDFVLRTRDGPPVLQPQEHHRRGEVA